MRSFLSKLQIDIFLTMDVDIEMNKFEKEFDRITDQSLSIVTSSSLLTSFDNIDDHQLLAFAKGFYHFVKYSPEYFSTLICKSPHNEIRLVLVDNLIDEFGGIENIHSLNTSGFHPELYRRFTRSLGISDQELNNLNLAKPYVKQMHDDFVKLALNSTFWLSLGALSPGIENIFFRWINIIYKGLKKRNCFSEDDLIYFKLHSIIDQIHGNKLKGCILKYIENESNLKLLETGAIEISRIHQRFFEALSNDIYYSLSIA